MNTWRGLIEPGENLYVTLKEQEQKMEKQRKSISYQDIRKNEEINAMIEKGNEMLGCRFKLLANGSKLC